MVFDVVNVNEVTDSFHAIVDDYLNDCKAESREPNKPFSSRFLKRVKPELHRALAITAKKSGKSLNKFVTEKLAQIAN